MKDWLRRAAGTLAAVAMVLLSISAVSASTWTQLRPAASPPARSGAAMAYDPVSQKVVLFGGYEVVNGAVVYVDDTWTFDGTTWTQVATRSAPSPRTSASMAFDAVTGELVLFGGYNGTLRLGDTWTFDGSRMRWRAERPKVSPVAVTGPMAFQDPGTGHACVFGGFDGRFYQLTTFRWTGRTWERVQSAHQPSARGAGIIANDPVLHQVVLFGGLGDVNPNNTWVWDGTDWTLQNPTIQPPLRYYSAAAYDPSAQGVVMFGGGPSLGDTWVWTGTDWVEQFPVVSPPPRESLSMAYDEAVGHALLFGGEDSTQQYDDTWEYSSGP